MNGMTSLTFLLCLTLGANALKLNKEKTEWSIQEGLDDLMDGVEDFISNFRWPWEPEPDPSMPLPINHRHKKFYPKWAVPNTTTLINISDAELQLDYTEPAKHKDYDVSIMTYKKGAGTGLDKFKYDPISQSLQKYGQWDGEDVNDFCNKFKKAGGKGNIFDVGGNIGSYSIPLAACLKKHGNGNNAIITIEAAPWNAKLLRSSMKYNNLDNMHLYEYAVGAPGERGVVDFVKPEFNAGKSQVAQVTHKQGVCCWGHTNVTLTTIDAIAKVEGQVMKNVFAMKLDIEGHELPALEGASEFLKNGPCTIFMEVRTETEPQIFKLLEQANYKRAGRSNGGTQWEHSIGIDNKWFERNDFDNCVANLV